MPRGLTYGIIYIPLDVRWPRSKKVRAMVVRHGLEGLAAWSLYLAMACYCRENLTDGWVPEEELGALAYPLPPDQTKVLLGLLEDYRLIGPGNGHGTNPGTDPGTDLGTNLGTNLGYLVRGYLKRNPTRAQALEQADRLAQGGRNGAVTRRSQGSSDPGTNPGTSPGTNLGVYQTETETNTSRARGHAPAREAGWTPSRVLDQPPAASRPRRGRPTPQPKTVAEIQAATRRPEGPAQDVHGWAAKARAGITTPPEEDPPMNQGPDLEPGKHAPPLPDTDPEPAADPEQDLDEEPTQEDLDDIPF